MASNRPDDMSRRDVLGSSLAMPLVGGASLQVSCGGRGPDKALLDPALFAAASWVKERHKLEAMIYKWQNFEKQLLMRAKLLNVSVDDPRGRRLPEAVAMQVINRQIEATYGVLDELACAASASCSATKEGALAKIALGLRVQGPYGWQPFALELLEGGLADLRGFRVG
jgi:hypothetical protein